MTALGAPSSAGHVSPTTARANAFVDIHRDAAEQMGQRLAEHLDDTDELVRALRRDLNALADPAYADGQRRVAPGIGPVAGVRNPLLAALDRGFRSATRRASPAELLQVADRLVREEPLEMPWLAFRILDRLVGIEPERAWQLLRASARRAEDWITVDSLAHPCARGVLLEPYRWAELEQLVYSPSRWERRLTGSTIAVMPFVDRVAGRRPDIAARGLSLIRELIGDADPEVQKALAWALRSLTVVDRPAVSAFCLAESELARAEDDGLRAWVIRDTLARLDPDDASLLRGRLAGVRRRPGATPTSRAAAAARAFGPLPDPVRLPEPPL
jgi:3-methyladenine DNA glycosylase AlkD